MTAATPGLSQIDDLCIQTIRFLSVDGVQAANSGHPGMCMGMAAAAHVLWTRHLRHNPDNPLWHNRDRFVLSAGHGSMLLYSLLHLHGYPIELEELKKFRQLGSKTPGHPEYKPEWGVEATTGPLGQGFTNAVGMAVAQKYLAAYYNKPGFELFDYNVYVIAGDGCMQEGITNEAASFAGHNALDNLVIIYDDNSITIDGSTELSMTEDVGKRFEALGWYVQEVSGDGTDMASFEAALNNAKNQKEKPSLIKLQTQIGYGSPNKQGKASTHGSPLGEDEIRLMKEKFGWDPDKSFVVPEEAREHIDNFTKQGKEQENKWNKMLADYQKQYPDLAEKLKCASDPDCKCVDIEKHLPKFDPDKPMATRKASGTVLDALMPHLPMVMGGSADLTPSNNTMFKTAEDFTKTNRLGRYIRYGIREHAMGGIMNGISTTNIVRPYGGTFLVFSDYMRASVRVAAMSNYRSIFVYTHDSIGLGEDGPTHQPVEHLASLRAMPNLMVWRPADANETAYAWKYILENRRPAAITLSRQGIPIINQDKYPSASNAEKGAYVLLKADNPQVLLLATGSEVEVALAAGEQLQDEGVAAQVVSMPCWELFEMQSQEYKDSVLPNKCSARVGIEAAVSLGWDKYLGCTGKFIGLSTFGESGPYKECFVKFGITADNIVATAKELI